MSSLLELYCLLQIRRIRTTPYHPQTDGLIDGFNGTLKSMLRKFVADSQNDWDTYLPYVLFAYREVPQESKGFSPFQLLYGGRVRGPLDVLRECWTEGEQDEPVVEGAIVRCAEADARDDGTCQGKLVQSSAETEVKL